MNRLTATAVAALVLLAVLAQREHAAFRRHVAGWEKMQTPPQQSARPYVPGQCKGWHAQLPIVKVPMYLDRELP